MLVPALIYVGFNAGGDATGGWGIPMATDIAFAVGIVSLLGRRVPTSLKLFLLTLAVADDLGAIAVIAIAYHQGLQPAWLAAAVVAIAAVYAMRRAQIWFLPAYVAVGVLAWYCMLRSGVHATVAGVALGFLTPHRPLHERMEPAAIVDTLRLSAGPRAGPAQPGLTADMVRNTAFRLKEAVPLDVRLIDLLHPWTGYVIIPIFALANAGVPLGREALSAATSSPVTFGVLAGLVVGKTVGVLGASLLAARVGLARLPNGVTLRQMTGIAMAAGIGFTVAIFVTGISLTSNVQQDEAKIGIFAASFIAAVLSAIVLAPAGRRPRPADPDGREAGEEPPVPVESMSAPS
jgi:NhaA family Na+:H+ antiporter